MVDVVSGEVFKAADIVLRLNEPTERTVDGVQQHELDLMKECMKPCRPLTLTLTLALTLRSSSLKTSF